MLLVLIRRMYFLLITPQTFKAGVLSVPSFLVEAIFEVSRFYGQDTGYRIFGVQVPLALE